jgi:hypothetical protein
MISLILIAGVIYFMSHDYSEERNINRLTDLGYSLQNEIIMAHQVEDGYERKIFLPDKIETADYLISNNENDIIITYRGSEFLFAIPVTAGSFVKPGENTIKKISGIVSIN